MREKVIHIAERLLQPFADFIVEAVKAAPTADHAMKMALFGLRIDYWLTNRGVYLK